MLVFFDRVNVQHFIDRFLQNGDVKKFGERVQCWKLEGDRIAFRHTLLEAIRLHFPGAGALGESEVKANENNDQFVCLLFSNVGALMYSKFL